MSAVSEVRFRLAWLDNAATGVALVGFVVLVMCLLGIWSRPAGLLASFWPANAVLLGIFVRVPELARMPASWVVAGAAYLLADLATGSSLEKAVWLNAANIAGVALGTMVFARLKPIDRHLGRPISINLVFVCCAIASLGAALVGMAANVQLFDGTPLEGLKLWFTSELSNYIALLPVLLAAPGLRQFRREGWFREQLPALKSTLLPVMALAAALLAGLFIDGPGSVALPIPALLWCAMRASVFATTVLTLVTMIWIMVMITHGWLDPIDNVFVGSRLQGLQISLSLIAAGPIAVACNVDHRDRKLAELRQRVNQDPMTGALNRDAFMERAEQLFELLKADERPMAIMVLDLDHFKSINDRYGHAAGDLVLSEFSSLVRGNLRDTDLFGRIGGEEFAIVMPGISAQMAGLVAERLRGASSEAVVEQFEQRIDFTVSIGLLHRDPPRETFGALLHAADLALYEAKREGRDRVVTFHRGDSV